MQSIKLEFFEADSDKDDNWETAVSGCDYVFARRLSYFSKSPKHEDEMIRPAVDGTLRVLKQLGTPVLNACDHVLVRGSWI